MRRTAVSLALAGVLALGACGGEASPKPAPLTRSPSASATPPTLPTGAVGTSEAAAQALVKYYFDALAYSSVTGKVSPLRPLGDTSCKSCNNVIRDIESLYRAGGHVSGSEYTVTEVVKSTQIENRWVLRIRVRSGDETVYENRTASPTRNSAGVTTAEFILSPRDDRLVIDQWDRL